MKGKGALLVVSMNEPAQTTFARLEASGLNGSHSIREITILLFFNGPDKLSPGMLGVTNNLVITSLCIALPFWFSCPPISRRTTCSDEI